MNCLIFFSCAPTDFETFVEFKRGHISYNSQDPTGSPLKEKHL